MGVYTQSKPKFNPKRCAKCQFHSEQTALGYHVRVSKTKAISVSCNYACITGHTCLQSKNKYETYDTRGTEFDGCKLFKEGPILRRGEYYGEDEDTSI